MNDGPARWSRGQWLSKTASVLQRTNTPPNQARTLACLFVDDFDRLPAWPYQEDQATLLMALNGTAPRPDTCTITC